jgi:hypothetical protein
MSRNKPKIVNAPKRSDGSLILMIDTPNTINDKRWRTWYGKSMTIVGSMDSIESAPLCRLECISAVRRPPGTYKPASKRTIPMIRMTNIYPSINRHL